MRMSSGHPKVGRGGVRRGSVKLRFSIILTSVIRTSTITLGSSMVSKKDVGGGTRKRKEISGKS